MIFSYNFLCLLLPSCHMCTTLCAVRLGPVLAAELSHSSAHNVRRRKSTLAAFSGVENKVYRAQ
jgi:hypothetical protein